MLHLALSLALALSASAEPKRAVHPDVGPESSADGCVECHTDATPEVVKQWEGGAHGLNLVKCFGCHGTVGKDFARAPHPSRCEGCHPAELASVAGALKAGSKACLACHSPHALVAEGKENPHPPR